MNYDRAQRKADRQLRREWWWWNNRGIVIGLGKWALLILVSAAIVISISMFVQWRYGNGSY